MSLEPILVDTVIDQKQREWESLLDEKELHDPQNNDLQLCDPTFNVDERACKYTWLTASGRKLLQQAWYRAGLQGRPIFYPENENQLYLYIFRESIPYQAFVTITVMVMLIAPALQPPSCLRDHHPSSSVLVWDLFLIAFSFVQLADVYLLRLTSHVIGPNVHFFSTTRIANHTKVDTTVFWQKVRCVSAALVAFDAFLDAISIRIPMICQIFVPVLFVATRPMLMQLSEGILYAISQITRFPKMSFIFLVSWAFMGFCLLRRYEDSLDGAEVNFSSYFEALYVNFHCVLSRPSVLYRLRAVFSNNNYISFYFVALTVIGDILLTTLIIALGTRAFREFSMKNLNQRLRYRYIATHSIYLLYCESPHIASTQGMLLPLWLMYCADCSRNYGVESIAGQQLLFALETSSITSAIPTSENQSPTTATTATDVPPQATSLPGLSKRGFFRLLGAMTTKIKFRMRPEKERNIIAHLQQLIFTLYTANTTTTSAAVAVTPSKAIEQSDTIDKRDSSFQSVAGSMQSVSLAVSKSAVMSQPSQQQSARSRAPPRSSQFIETMSGVDLNLGGFDRFVQNLFMRFMSLFMSRTMMKDSMIDPASMQQRVYDLCYAWYTSYFLVSLWKLNVWKKIRQPEKFAHLPWIAPKTQRMKVKYYRIAVAVLYLLVVVSAFLLSRQDVTPFTIFLCWFVFLGYVVRNMIRLVVVDTDLTIVRFDILVNFVYFVCLLAMRDGNGAHVQSAVTVVLFLQSIRILIMFFQLSFFTLFVALMPVVLRVCVLLFLIVYVFAVLGHITLCQVLTSSDMVAVSDDDAAAWSPFASFLQYNTFTSSIYTVAISAVLSNWSMVMDAAVAAAPAQKGWTYLFFYIMRISLCVVTIPLLLSCIMQAFIQRLRLAREMQQLVNEAKRAAKEARLLAATMVAAQRIQQMQERLSRQSGHNNQGGAGGRRRPIRARRPSSEDEDTDGGHDDGGDGRPSSSRVSNPMMARPSNQRRKSIDLWQDTHKEDEDANEVKLDDDDDEDDDMEGDYDDEDDDEETVSGSEMNDEEDENRRSSLGAVSSYKVFAGMSTVGNLNTLLERQRSATIVAAAAAESSSAVVSVQTSSAPVDTGFGGDNGDVRITTSSKSILKARKTTTRGERKGRRQPPLLLPEVCCREERVDVTAALWSSTGRAIFEVPKPTPYEKEMSAVVGLAQQAQASEQVSMWSELLQDCEKFVSRIIYQQRPRAAVDTELQEIKAAEGDVASSVVESPDPITPPKGSPKLAPLPMMRRFVLTDTLIVRHQRRFEDTFSTFETVFQGNKSESNNDTNDYSKSSSYTNIDITALQKSQYDLTREDKVRLAVQWLHDAAKGRNLLYPHTKRQLKCFLWHRSSFMTLLLYLVAIMQMISVFLIIPRCGGGVHSSTHSVISLQGLEIFDLFCALFYIFELVLDLTASSQHYYRHQQPRQLGQNNWTSSLDKQWMLIRLVFVLLLFLKSIPALAASHMQINNVRLIRCLYPVLLIARDDALSDITKGIVRSTKKTAFVYLFFATILVVFTCAGYWLFHRFETHAMRFNDLGTAFLTILQSATAAPFTLYVIIPYYDISPLSTIFFLTLTYASELLCISLIVGAGNVYFNSYGAKVIEARRNQLHQSMQAIWLLLLEDMEDDEGSRKEEEENEDSGIVDGGIKLQPLGSSSRNYDKRQQTSRQKRMSTDTLFAFCRHFDMTTHWTSPVVLASSSLHQKGSNATSKEEEEMALKHRLLFSYAQRHRIIAASPESNGSSTSTANTTDCVLRREFFEMLSFLMNGYECQAKQHVIPISVPSVDVSSSSEDAIDVAALPSNRQRRASSASSAAGGLMSSSSHSSSHNNSASMLSGNPGTGGGGGRVVMMRRGSLLSRAMVVHTKQSLAEVRNGSDSDSSSSSDEDEEVHKEEGDGEGLTQMVTPRGHRARSTTLKQEEQSNVVQDSAVSKSSSPKATIVHDQNKQQQLSSPLGATDPSSSYDPSTNDHTASSPQVVEVVEEVVSISLRKEDATLLGSVFPQLLRIVHVLQGQIDTADLQKREADEDFFQYLPFMYRVLWTIKDVCDRLTFTFVITQRSKTSLLDLMSYLCHFFLLIQLIYYSARGTIAIGWSRFGYFLETCFWAEMLIRIVAIGELRFFRDSISLVRCALNIASFIAMVAVGSNYSNNTTNAGYLCLVAFQCLRLVLVLARLRGNGRYKLALLSTSRALFLLALALYFFTIFAQDAFCSVLVPNAYAGSPTNDDAASSWNEFSHILNFTNYPQALFTLFEVTVLGSWSMVMDAAATIDSGKNQDDYLSSFGNSLYINPYSNSNSNSTNSSDPPRHLDPQAAQAYFFFFIFRLFMTLIVLPLLISYMVRSYIALLDQITFIRGCRKKRKEEQLQLQLQQLQLQRQQELSLQQQGDSNDASGTSPMSSNNPMHQLSTQGKKLSRRSSLRLETALAASSLSTNQERGSNNDHKSHLSSVPESTTSATTPPSLTTPLPSPLPTRQGYLRWYARLERAYRLYQQGNYQALFKFVPLVPAPWVFSLGFLEVWDVTTLQEQDVVRLYGAHEDLVLMQRENGKLQVLAYTKYLQLVWQTTESMDTAKSFDTDTRAKKEENEEDKDNKYKKQLLQRVYDAYTNKGTRSF